MIMTAGRSRVQHFQKKKNGKKSSEKFVCATAILLLPTIPFTIQCIVYTMEYMELYYSNIPRPSPNNQNELFHMLERESLNCHHVVNAEHARNDVGLISHVRVPLLFT